MKINIEIPKEFEDEFFNDKFKSSLSRLCVDAYCVAGKYEIETAEMLIKAFENASYDKIRKQDAETFHLLVAGTRHYTDKQEAFQILSYMLSAYKDVEIISGGAKGADTLAEQYARINNYKLSVFNAEWNTYGKIAGIKRNIDMHNYLNQFDEKGVLCFWDGKSKGTAHNFELVKKAQNPPPLKVWNYVTKEWVQV